MYAHQGDGLDVFFVFYLWTNAEENCKRGALRAARVGPSLVCSIRHRIENGEGQRLMRNVSCLGRTPAKARSVRGQWWSIDCVGVGLCLRLCARGDETEHGLAVDYPSRSWRVVSVLWSPQVLGQCLRCMNMNCWRAVGRLRL